MNLTYCIRGDNNKRAANVRRWFALRLCWAFCYTWVSSQTGFQTFFGKASSKAVIVTSRDVYCRAEQEEVGQPCVSSSVEPHEPVAVARKITWPEKRTRGELSEHSEIWMPFIQIALCFSSWSGCRLECAPEDTCKLSTEQKLNTVIYMQHVWY